jgi:hypothetical protein
MQNIPQGADPKTGRQCKAGGIPAKIEGGTLKRPIRFSGGVNGGGKGPAVKQPSPSGHGGKAGMKMARQRGRGR